MKVEQRAARRRAAGRRRAAVARFFGGLVKWQTLAVFLLGLAALSPCNGPRPPRRDGGPDREPGDWSAPADPPRRGNQRGRTGLLPPAPW